jgi:hypothetical protein
MDQRYHYPCLPLAIYREVASHLRQVEGLRVELLPQTDPRFDYSLSQLEGLHLHWDEQSYPQAAAQAEAILSYYRQRYPEWMTAAVTSG